MNKQQKSKSSKSHPEQKNHSQAHTINSKQKWVSFQLWKLNSLTPNITSDKIVCANVIVNINEPNEAKRKFYIVRTI